MDIERINDNTFKVYISYIDIEERGFSRDEIWFNKDKSEQLFWEMMDEVHEDDHFDELDGPLWIQVHAMEKGLEVIVTRTELAKDERSDDGRNDDLPNKLFKSAASGSLGSHEFDDFSSYMDDLDDIPENYTFEFESFEDVIGLSKKLAPGDFKTSLYHYEEKYYMNILFEMDTVEQLEMILNVLSVISEFGQTTKTTIHLIQEYGKEIISENVLEELNKHF